MRDVQGEECVPEAQPSSMSAVAGGGGDGGGGVREGC